MTLCTGLSEFPRKLAFLCHGMRGWRTQRHRRAMRRRQPGDREYIPGYAIRFGRGPKDHSVTLDIRV